MSLEKDSVMHRAAQVLLTVELLILQRSSISVLRSAGVTGQRNQKKKTSLLACSDNTDIFFESCFLERFESVESLVFFKNRLPSA